MRDLFHDDSAQATTEYILILFIAISFFMIVYAKLLRPFFSRFGTKISGMFDNLLSKGNLHALPFKL